MPKYRRRQLRDAYAFAGFVPTAEVAGRNVEPFLPAGDDAPRWRRIFNETQIMLHRQACNESREARGELPINSVWFWGAGGPSGVAVKAPYATVWSDHPLAAGLAAASGMPSMLSPFL
jgi:hypothetical protein